MSDYTVHLSQSMKARLARAGCPFTEAEALEATGGLVEAIDNYSITLGFPSQERNSEAYLEDIRSIVKDPSKPVDWDATLAALPPRLSASVLGLAATHIPDADLKLFRAIAAKTGEDSLRKMRNPRFWPFLSNYININAHQFNVIKTLLALPWFDPDATLLREIPERPIEHLINHYPNAGDDLTKQRYKRAIRELVSVGAEIPEAYLHHPNALDVLDDVLPKIEQDWEAWKGNKLTADKRLSPENITHEQLLSFRVIGKLAECFADARWETHPELKTYHFSRLRPAFQRPFVRELAAATRQTDSTPSARILGPWAARVQARSGLETKEGRI